MLNAHIINDLVLFKYKSYQIRQWAENWTFDLNSSNLTYQVNLLFKLLPTSNNFKHRSNNESRWKEELMSLDCIPKNTMTNLTCVYAILIVTDKTLGKKQCNHISFHCWCMCQSNYNRILQHQYYLTSLRNWYMPMTPCFRHWSSFGQQTTN